jgi:hypothetical protein
MIKIFQDIRDRKAAKAWRIKQAEKDALQNAADIEESKQRIIEMAKNTIDILNKVNVNIIPACLQGIHPDTLKNENPDIIIQKLLHLIPEELQTESEIIQLESVSSTLFKIVGSYARFILEEVPPATIFH